MALFYSVIMMTQNNKIRVAVVYGGRSAEHEISLRSAKSVLEYLDKDKYDVIPIAIDKQGQWLLNDLSVLPNADAEQLLVANEGSSKADFFPAPQSKPHFDVVFPVLHGTLGEDGTIQGLLELADIAYVGCRVLASAMCMDKDISKRLAIQAGVPIPDYLCVRHDVLQHLNELAMEIEQRFAFPVFVKPANTGSSVGITKVASVVELGTALEIAFAHDKKVLIEQAIDAREIEIGVLENLEGDEPLVSAVAGEIINAQGEFYSYKAKYSDDSHATLQVPANVTNEQLETIKSYARTIFTTLECSSMARVDFFIDKNNHNIYFNELNTIPGFTTISLYPRLWEVSGMPYSQLLSHLIELALHNFSGFPPYSQPVPVG